MLWPHRKCVTWSTLLLKTQYSLLPFPCQQRGIFIRMIVLSFSINVWQSGQGIDGNVLSCISGRKQCQPSHFSMKWWQNGCYMNVLAQSWYVVACLRDEMKHEKSEWGPGKSEEAQSFCLSEGDSVLLTRNPQSAKAFQHWFVLSGWQAYLGPPHGWLGQISGVWCIQTPLPPSQADHQGWASHALSVPVMTARGYTIPSRPDAHREWSAEYSWSKFAKTMFIL